MWRIFKRDPLDIIDRRKQRVEKQRQKAKKKVWQRKKRTENWHEFNQKLRQFFTDPFAKHEPSPAQRERRRIKAYKRQERKVAIRKWWLKFRQNPWRIIIPSKKRRDPNGGYLFVYYMA